MRVEKVLNNNLVISVLEQNREIILMGRGIGFGLKPGMEIDEGKIEKKFYRFSDSMKHCSWNCWSGCLWSIWQ